MYIAQKEQQIAQSCNRNGNSSEFIVLKKGLL
jgi:hypothetical protein